MFHTLYKIISKHPKSKNVSFLPFPVLMYTQPTNTTQKLCKRIMPFYNWTPIPNNNKFPHMFMIYNHYYCWLCSQNFPLINIIRPWVGWKLSMPLRFYTHQWTYKAIFLPFFFFQNWTHQFHSRHSVISSGLCNKIFRAILLTIVYGCALCSGLHKKWLFSLAHHKKINQPFNSLKINMLQSRPLDWLCRLQE
jgi:hypothetical protein